MDTVKERIEKDAKLLFADNGPLVWGYVCGAVAERNKAVDECIALLKEDVSLTDDDVVSKDWVLTKRMESLKLKV